MNAREWNENETDGDQLPEVVQATALDSLARAEVDIQIATAHRFPRSLEKFRRDAMRMATFDEETAAGCFYCVPRAGKQVEGPSIRFAEIVASAWGNIRFGARIVAEDKNFVVAQGIAHDLESNVAPNFEVRRRITDKHGRRFSDDMIVTTCNAACAIAVRNAILKAVPGLNWKPIYNAAKKVAVGNTQSLTVTRTKALEYFAKLGVNQERVLAVLDKKSVEDIDMDDITTLVGLKTAIKDGDTTIEQAFPVQPSAPPTGKTSFRKPKERSSAADSGRVDRRLEEIHSERQPGEDQDEGAIVDESES